MCRRQAEPTAVSSHGLDAAHFTPVWALPVLFLLEGMIGIAALLAAGLMAAPIIVAALYAGSHVHTRLSDAQMLRMVNLLLLGSAAAVLAKAWWE